MEYWDIYDKERNLANRLHKRGQKLNDGEFHLCVRVWIIDSDKQLLIQQRQPWKSYPNKWDCSVAGSALAGETSQEAIIREAKEELSIILAPQELELILSEQLDYCFDDNWLLKKDISTNSIVLQEEEVQAIRWVSFNEIRELIQTNQFIPMEHLETIIYLLKEKQLLK